MNRLTAVTEILLQAVGEPAPSALDSTGSWPSKVYGAGIRGQAEFFLDTAMRTILSTSMASSLMVYQIAVPTYYYSYSTGTPSFTFAQELTDSGGAVVRHNYSDTTNKRIYVSVKTGTPAALATSLGGFTVTAATAITSSRIAGDTTWLHAEAADGYETKVLEFRRETANGQAFFYDRNPSGSPDADNNPLGSTFTADITVKALPDLDFETMPYPIQNWAVKQAILDLAKAKKASDQWIGLHTAALMSAKQVAMQHEINKMKINVLQTAHAQAFRGYRPDLSGGVTSGAGFR